MLALGPLAPSHLAVNCKQKLFEFVKLDCEAVRNPSANKRNIQRPLYSVHPMWSFPTPPIKGPEINKSRSRGSLPAVLRQNGGSG